MAAVPPEQRITAFLTAEPLRGRFGLEPILLDGRPAGYVTSGAYVPALGAVVLLARIERAAESGALRAALNGTGGRAAALCAAGCRRRGAGVRGSAGMKAIESGRAGVAASGGKA
jgi:glycine cleavage system aminomethyltransferase T